MKPQMPDISAYLCMVNTPAGAILCHILKEINVTQRQLSERAGISPQHINALIKGNRRFSVNSSLMIEEALGIEQCGLFFKCQCNYDIEQAKSLKFKKPDISRLRKSTFWDVNLNQVNWQKGKQWAILRVLEYGCKEDFDEISKVYGRKSFLSEISKIRSTASSAMLRNASLFGLL